MKWSLSDISVDILVIIRRNNFDYFPKISRDLAAENQWFWYVALTQ